MGGRRQKPEVRKQWKAEFNTLLQKVCHKKQEKFHPTLETIDSKEP
jgi:hypothetical protein